MVAENRITIQGVVQDVGLSIGSCRLKLWNDSLGSCIIIMRHLISRCLFFGQKQNYDHVGATIFAGLGPLRFICSQN